jgi:UDP-glucose 4-epimerase
MDGSAKRTMRVLVTGGAGYIGSHVALRLSDVGHDVVVYDNLSTGHPWAVTHGELVVGDVADLEKLQALFRHRQFDAVINLAGRTVAPDSVADPLGYYSANTGNMLGLLETCVSFGVDILVFSSTAAVYGAPQSLPVREDAVLAPINPYGASKMMCERMIEDVAAATVLRYVTLRYFNAAGADPAGRIGQSTPEASHLIKIACQVAVGLRPALTVFGTDYATPDGTCIRDYIHVDDLAQAHVQALGFLSEGNGSTVLNVGYGHGSSVLEVIETVKRVSGVDFVVRLGPRRPGDAPEMVADNRLIREILGWSPRGDDLEFIVRTALEWERKSETAA